MDNVKTWGEAITVSLIKVEESLTGFFPVLLGALWVLIAGWVIAVTLGKLVAKVTREMGFDRAMDRLGFSKKMKEFGFNFEFSSILGGLFRWFLMLVFLMAATDILKLTQVTSFINSILLYIPNVVVAVVILTVVFILGNFTYRFVKGSTRAAGVMSATLLAIISKWSIIVFGVFAALIQLGVASSLVNTMFVGIVAMFSLAGGLAFGLGGKDDAQLIIRKVREELMEKK